eukprot:CAMPEP_0194314778 /NCGR_PEP_ID=MMETSP0171-20130528/11609_1 /TAXON_ID=218684 /ORGANISM="Corethron pennatum, Strain L29A3" /LENGTH=291 /DNA_ID=CAMNT_0039070335 /DNA_START=49 /DNA_END=924 /DNA_ORIENTATION=-
MKFTVVSILSVSSSTHALVVGDVRQHYRKSFPVLPVTPSPTLARNSLLSMGVSDTSIPGSLFRSTVGRAIFDTDREEASDKTLAESSSTTMTEMIAEADSIFDSIDTNKDGGISNAELRSYLEDLGYLTESIRYLFTALDTNADGVISREEMRFAFSKYEATALYMAFGLGNEVTDNSYRDAVEHIRSSADIDEKISTESRTRLADLFFNMIDTDESGRIDAEELREHFREAENENSSFREVGNFSSLSVESIFAALDLDLDGTITREEMREGFNQYDPKALLIALGMRAS